MGKLFGFKKKNRSTDIGAIFPVDGMGLIALPEDENYKYKESSAADFSPLLELARLLNVSAERIKDECCLFQLRKLMSKTGKLAVRVSETESELKKAFLNCDELKIKELLVSPSYIPTCQRLSAKTGLSSLYVGAIIDFPFGEGGCKAKLAEIKECISGGADGVTVVFSAMMLKKENRKQFKKQIKKMGRLYKSNVCIALDAAKLSEEEIKFAVKTIDNSKTGSISFIFGETEETELKNKMREINAYKSKKPIKAIGNVKTPEGITELIKLGIDEIITPYADEIGAELVKRFKIKSVKLR